MNTQKMQIISEQARERFAALAGQLAASPENKKMTYFIDQFIACFNATPAYSGYKHMPTTANEVYEQVKQRLGVQATHDFLYACILKAILQTLDSAAFARLPIRVQGHQLVQFDRLISNPNSVTQSAEIDKDLFHKDFGLATLRLYAAAAQFIDYSAGIGRSLVMKGGLLHVPHRLALFAKVGGFRPFFEIHTHLSYRDEFNEEGWNECYRCCADLYAVHPEVLGMYGGSWFYDPVVSEISPRLGYLREIPQRGGAFFLFDSVNEQSSQDAISTSPTRKKLFTDGAYQPKSYALIWPQAAQIEWAKKNKEPFV